MPTDTVPHWVEHRLDKPWAWVQILASVMFFIFSVAFIPSMLPWRSDGRSNLNRGLQKFNNVDPNNDRQIYEKLLYIHSPKWKHHNRHSRKYDKNPEHEC